MGKKIPHSISVNDEMDNSYNHIPADPGSGYLTLCGWVDVDHDYQDLETHPINCPQCLSTLRYCRNLTFKTK